MYKYHSTKTDVVSFCVCAAVPIIIVPTERILPCKAWHVDVILNEHDVSNFIATIEPPRCVCHNQSFHAQQVEDSHWVRHLE